MDKKKQEPLVSIITPVYNASQYLNQSLNSIQSQTYSNWECIIVDDGSTDNSGEICDEYEAKDSRFKVIHKENEGSAVARNVALQYASGDYVASIDADDWVDPDFIQNLLDATVIDVALEKADVVNCSFYFYDDGKDNYVANKPQSLDPRQVLLDTLYNKVHAGMPLKLIRRDFIKQHNLCFPKYGYYEDVYFFLSILINNPIVCYCEKPGYHYRKNSQSQTYTRDISKRIITYKQIVYNLISFSQKYHLIKDKDILEGMRYNILTHQKSMYQIYYRNTIKLYNCFNHTPKPLAVNAMSSKLEAYRFLLSKIKYDIKHFIYVHLFQ